MNYIALAGALEGLGRKGEKPMPPLNLVGDFGGGGLILAFGIACALLEAKTSGQGQVIDAAMVDGAAVLTTFIYGLRAMGIWQDERGTNLLDTGAHFYEVYETSDGKFVSIGSIEPQFYARLLEHTGLAQEADLPHQMDRTQWPAMKERLEAIFKTKTRDEWCALLESDPELCFAPVLSMAEAHAHPHNKERETFVEVAGIIQPAPAPRFSRTPGAVSSPPAHAGQHTDEALADWGFTPDEITKLREAGAVK
jgi:alpha-methylacyl-CoA racemase